MDVFASYVDEDELREDETGEEPVAETSGAGTSQYDPGSLLPVSVDLTPSVAPILVPSPFSLVFIFSLYYIFLYCSLQRRLQSNLLFTIFQQYKYLNI